MLKKNSGFQFNKGALDLRKEIKGLLGLLIVITILLSGCILIPVNQGKWALVDQWDYYVLPEHYYTYSYLIYASSNCTEVKVSINCSTAPSYGFEIWIMTLDQFGDFVSSNKVNVVDHSTVYSGSYTFYSDSLIPGEYYRVVIDNTDYGWVDTDWDGFDDYCAFDAEVYQYIGL